MKTGVFYNITGKLLLFWLTVIVCYSCTPSAYGKDFPMLRFSVVDGLPSNKVYDIFRDSKGFLWIASDKGVGRYNGIKFEKFTTFDGLADNEVFFFREDYYGRIWMGTYNGELCYYKNGIFHNAQNTPFLKLPPRSHSFIHYINVEKDSSVTIHYANQTFFINIKNDEISQHDFKNKHNDSLNYTIRENNLNYRSIYNTAVDVIKQKTGYKIICGDSSVFIDKSDNIKKIVRDAETSFLRLSYSQNRKYYYDTVQVYDENIKPVFRFSKKFYVKHDLLFHPLRAIYVSNEDCMFTLVPGEGLYQKDSLILKGDISSVTQDIAGNYWVGTLNKGIFWMPGNYNKNTIYRNAYSSDIRYCASRNSHLFYATADNRLYCINNNRPECLFRYAKLMDGKLAEMPGYMVDSNNRLYFLYNGVHIIIDNLFNKQNIKKYFLGLTYDGVKNVFLNEDGLFYNDPFRIYKIDYNKIKAGEEVFEHATVYNYLKGATERIFCCAQAEDNSIWYNTVNKIYKIVGDSSVPQKQYKDIHFSTFVFCGQYIVGLTGHNQLLICCQKSDGTVHVDSVTNQKCIWNKIYKVDSTHLLISTDSKYRVITLYPTSSKIHYDLLTLENLILPMLPENICTDKNNCYFFENGDITSIDFKDLLIKTAPPKLYFTSMKIGQKSVPVDTEYTVPYNSARNLILSYSTISFNGKDVNYQYSISKDSTENWNNINSDEINLINSSYGNYIIKIKAKTLSSEYSQPIVFKLHILKPFWATWWFISLSIVALGSVIALVVWQRIKTVVDKRERAHDDKVRFMRSEYKALNALMNPHFIFNTLNNVQSLVNGNNKLAANEYLRIFSDLVRQNMHNVSKELIPLQKEMDLVQNYLLLEKLRFEDKLNYTINIDPTLELYDIMVSPLLIQPLVENSIKHGILPLKDRVGVIKINIYDKGGMLYIEIRDNGVGLNNAKAKEGSLHESYGLSNIKKRIEQLSIIQGKDMTFNMGEETDAEGIRWTTVTVTMPL